MLGIITWLLFSFGLLIWNYNPEMEDKHVIQILRLEDTGFWSRSWGIVAIKSLGPGMMVHIHLITGDRGEQISEFKATWDSASFKWRKA